MIEIEKVTELAGAARRVELLVRQYGDLVYAAACRQMGAEAAGDLVQAVWMVTARRASAGRLPEEKYMVGWLLKVARYVAQEARRAEARRTYHERRAAEKRRERQAQDDASDQEILRVVDEALLGMGVVDREVVARRYLWGQEVRDVALAVGMNEDSARRRIARALEKLRKLLARRGVRAPAVMIGAALASQVMLKPPVGWAAVALGGAMKSAVLKWSQATLWRMTMAKVQVMAAVLTALTVTGIGAVLAHTAIASRPASAPTSIPPAVLAEDSPVKNGMRTQITAKSKSFAAGEPMAMTLQVENVGKQVRHYRQQIRTLNNGLIVRDEAHKEVPYLAGSAQIQTALVPLEPGQKKQIEVFDLGAIFYLRKPGTYTVSFPGAAAYNVPNRPPAWDEAADDGLPESNTFHFEISAAPDSDGDPAGKLLPLVHENWKLVGNANGKTEKVKPGANWSEVMGRRFYFADEPTIYKRDTAFVFVWLCDEPAAEATVAQGIRDMTSEYVGKAGRWHIYVGTDGPARDRWPKAAEEIKKALEGAPSNF